MRMRNLATKLQNRAHRVLSAVVLVLLAFPGSVTAQLPMPPNPAPDALPAELINGDGAVFNQIVQLVLLIVGAIAVLMLIVGGIRYIVSGGDSSAVEGAKNTILYAIIGIIIVFLSYAAVEFLISNLQAT